MSQKADTILRGTENDADAIVINLINDSVIQSVTCRHLMAVLVSFLKYHFSYLNHWIFLYSKLYI